MEFRMDGFTMSKGELLPQFIQFKDENGVVTELKFYTLAEPIKLEPTQLIPSFYMVNKYGEVYNDTQYVLVPYIRFAVPDPSETYKFSSDGVSGFNYARNPFHPYWIGGVTYSGVLAEQPNKYAKENLDKLMDLYLIGTNRKNYYTAHGVKASNNYWGNLSGIGQDLVPDEGSLKDGMFMPVNARYLQANTQADLFAGFSNNHALVMSSVADDTRPTAVWYYGLKLPEVSADATQPYILPPLFKDLMSWYNDTQPASANSYAKSTFGSNAISILTFGVKQA